MSGDPRNATIISSRLGDMVEEQSRILIEHVQQGPQSSREAILARNECTLDRMQGSRDRMYRDVSAIDPHELDHVINHLKDQPGTGAREARRNIIEQQRRGRERGGW